MQHRLRRRLLAVAIAVGGIAAARADGAAGDRPPRLLVIITGESNSGGDPPIVMTRFMERYAATNAAIEEVCRTVPGTASVDTLDAPLRDANHWNHAGMKVVAGRMLDVVAGLGLIPADPTPPGPRD